VLLNSGRRLLPTNPNLLTTLTVLLHELRKCRMNGLLLALRRYLAIRQMILVLFAVPVGD